MRHQNWFASQSAAAGQSCLQRGIHFCILNLARRSGEPSLFNLPDLIALASKVGVIVSKFVQRPSGSVHEEVFEGLGNVLLDFENGLTPLDPEKVNEALAKSIARHANSNKHRAELSPASVHPVPSGSLGMSSFSHEFSSVTRVVKKARVTGTLESQPREFRDDDSSWAGGLRSPHKFIMSRQRTINVGVQIRNAIDSYLDTYPGLEVSLLDSIGKPLGDTRIPAERVDGLRVRVSKLLCRTLGHTLLEGQWEFFNEPVENGYCKTSLRHAFLKLWAKAIDDPAADVVDWLETGAPAGITVHPKLEGIWPPVEGDEAKIESEFFPQISNLSTTMQGLKKILQLFLPPRDILKKGYLRPFDSLDECRSALGGFEPVLSRLGCISTEKHTSDGGTVIKNRIILDAKQSEVTSATSREYRSVMPRLTYAVTDALCMMSNLEEDETLEQLIADISDAFWLIPLHPKERRFFVASFQGKFLVFERTAKGSRGAPLTFCTIMGLATRLLQSLLLRDHLHMKLTNRMRACRCTRATHGSLQRARRHRSTGFSVLSC